MPPSGVEQFVGGNSVTLINRGGEALTALHAAIVAARKSVWLEMYWFADDATGLRFFEALGDAAERGLEVRLLYDALGCFSTDEAHFERLRARGAQVVEYNPIRPFQRLAHLSQMTVRNHRKLLVVDDSVAFIGGVNLVDRWLPVEQGGSGWRDDLARVGGPVVLELARSFTSCWNEACEQPFEPRLAVPERRGEMDAAVLSQAGLRAKRHALEAYVARLWQARQQILIANAYFLPNLRIRRALAAAARRGVDVRIMLPATSDVEVVRHASRGVWGPLLHAGVRIFEYLPSMLHSKTAVIDAQWVTIGSFNLDSISIRNNHELNLSVLHDGFAACVVDSFMADQAQCREVDLASFERRSLLDRAAESVMYWFRGWL